MREGINGLDLIDSPLISSETFKKGAILLEQNFGIDYPKEKFDMLFTMIKEEGWTEYRFMQTLKWFLKNKRYSSWTIADWFDFGVRLYPYEWYLEQQAKAGNYTKALPQMDVYIMPDGKTRGYRWKDGMDLPLEKES